MIRPATAPTGTVHFGPHGFHVGDDRRGADEPAVAEIEVDERRQEERRIARLPPGPNSRPPASDQTRLTSIPATTCSVVLTRPKRSGPSARRREPDLTMSTTCDRDRSTSSLNLAFDADSGIRDAAIRAKKPRTPRTEKLTPATFESRHSARSQVACAKIGVSGCPINQSRALKSLSSFPRGYKCLFEAHFRAHYRATAGHAILPFRRGQSGNLATIRKRGLTGAPRRSERSSSKTAPRS